MSHLRDQSNAAIDHESVHLNRDTEQPDVPMSNDIETPDFPVNTGDGWKKGVGTDMI
jgi:hypothetical protein